MLYAVCCLLWVVGCGLWVVCCGLCVVCCALCVVCYVLCVACCVLNAVCCVLLVVGCGLWVLGCVLWVVCCVLCVVRCVLCVVCCVLCVCARGRACVRAGALARARICFLLFSECLRPCLFARARVSVCGSGRRYLLPLGRLEWPGPIGPCPRPGPRAARCAPPHDRIQLPYVSFSRLPLPPAPPAPPAPSSPPLAQPPSGRRWARPGRWRSTTPSSTSAPPLCPSQGRRPAPARDPAGRKGSGRRGAGRRGGAVQW